MKNSATFPLHGIFLRSKFNPFFFYISVDFPEKESATKFCGVLILFHEISTFQSFPFDVSDVIPRKYITFQVCFLLRIFVDFMEKEPLAKFYDFLIIFYKVMKLGSFE